MDDSILWFLLSDYFLKDAKRHVDTLWDEISWDVSDVECG